MSTKFQVVTEIGNFASLNIKDPTTMEIEAEDADINELVKSILDEDKDDSGEDEED